MQLGSEFGFKSVAINQRTSRINVIMTPYSVMKLSRH